MPIKDPYKNKRPPIKDPYAISAITGKPLEERISHLGPTEGVLENLPIGAIAGGTIGSALAIAKSGGFLPAILLTGLSSAIGESVQQIGEIFEKETGVNIPYIKGEQAPKTPMESLARTGMQFGTGLAGEAGFRGLSKLFGAGKEFALAPAAKSLTPEEQSLKVLFEREGIPHTGFDISPHEFSGRLESWAEQGLISGGIMKRFNKRVTDAFNLFKNKELGKIGTKSIPETLGKMTKDVINDVMTNLDNFAGTSFNQAKKLAGIEPLLPTSAFKAQAKKMLLAEQVLTRKVPTEVATGLTDEFGRPLTREVLKTKYSFLNYPKLLKLIKEINELPDTITYAQAREYQKRLGSEVAKMKDIPLGEMKQLFKGIATDIDSMTTTNPAALEALTQGKQAWKKLSDVEESFLGDVINKYPEDVFKSIFKPKAITEIRELRKIVPTSQWHYYQRAVAEDILEKSGKNFNITRTLENYTDETLKEVFAPETIQALKEMGLIAGKVKPLTRTQMVQKRMGFNIVNIAQGGLLINMAAGWLAPVTSGLLFLSPAITAKLITSKTGAKWLTTGLTMKATHPQASQVIKGIIDVVGGTATRGLMQTEGQGILQSLSNVKGPVINLENQSTLTPPPNNRRLTNMLNQTPTVIP